jgi:hypothetical protein
VGNAEASLRAMAAGDTYQSELEYADGVLDGIRHWSELESDASRVAGPENQIFGPIA